MYAVKQANSKEGIPVLTGTDNYRIWQFQLMGLLEEKGLALYAEGQVEEPTEDRAKLQESADRTLEYKIWTRQALGIIKRYTHLSLWDG